MDSPLGVDTSKSRLPLVLLVRTIKFYLNSHGDRLKHIVRNSGSGIADKHLLHELDPRDNIGISKASGKALIALTLTAESLGIDSDVIFSNNFQVKSLATLSVLFYSR